MTTTASNTASPTTSTRLSDDKEPSIHAKEHDNDHLKTPLFNPDVDISGVDERKLIRKIDLALIPWLSFLYLLSFLDRTSIGK